MTREELQSEIARHAPWYQSIDFPEQGISTTDDPANAMIDAAWDNKTDEISLEEAARLRPKPKWRFIQQFLPPLAGLEVLEIAGMRYNPFSREASICSDTDVNYLVRARRNA